MPDPLDDTGVTREAQGPRVWCDGIDAVAGGEVVTLDAGEARHLTRALRLRPGDAVTLLDGRGTVAAALLLDATPGSPTACRVEWVRRAAPTSPRLALFVAPPKGPRLEAMVNQLVQVGADTVTLMATARSVASPRASRRDRLERSVIEACKQSGRPWAMDVAGPVAFADALADAGGRGGVKLLASPRGEAAALPAEGDRVEVWIGPEGGFTEAEHDAAIAAGLSPWRLGPHVMRIETAAVAASAIVKAGR